MVRGSRLSDADTMLRQTRHVRWTLPVAGAKIITRFPRRIRYRQPFGRLLVMLRRLIVLAPFCCARSLLAGR